MAATVTAVLPLSDALVVALARVRLTTAGRLAAYFEGAAADPEVVGMRLVQALGTGAPGARELGVWIDELIGLPSGRCR